MVSGCVLPSWKWYHESLSPLQHCVLWYEALALFHSCLMSVLKKRKKRHGLVLRSQLLWWLYERFQRWVAAVSVAKPIAWLKLIQHLLSTSSFCHSVFAFSIFAPTTLFPLSLSSPLFLPDEQFRQQTVPLLRSHQWLHSKSCPCSYFLGRAIFSESICFSSYRIKISASISLSNCLGLLGRGRKVLCQVLEEQERHLLPPPSPPHPFIIIGKTLLASWFHGD